MRDFIIIIMNIIIKKKEVVLKSVRSQKENTPPRVRVRGCARVTLSHELYRRGLIARALAKRL